MKRLFRKLGLALGIDSDDLQVIAAIVVAVLLVALVVVVVAGAFGLGVALFEALRGG
jgi:flagellar biosynthesis protein FliQ